MTDADADAEPSDPGPETAAVAVTRDIAAPAEHVWSMISDVTRMGEWSPETTGCAWRDGATGPEVGARFSGRNQAGIRRWSTSCRVVEAERGRSFVFDVTSGPLAVARWSYRIEPTEPGRCRVTETWTDHRGGFVKLAGRVVSGVSDRAEHNRSTMEETLDRLARAAEGVSPG